MGSKVEVWKLVEPVAPCGSVRKYSSRKLEKGVNIHQLQEEIASVEARVNSIDEQIGIIKAALPELDNKIRYASLGMPMSSFPLDELQNLKDIHFKLLQFWEDLNRKQLEKLKYLSDCLQLLEEQKRGNKNTLPDGIDNYNEIGQHINEKVLSDIRKNQELEAKLYFDRITTVPTKSSKPTTTLYSPPRRGPQQIGREQTGMSVSIPPTPALQRISIPSTYRISTPPTPSQQRFPTPSPPAQQRVSIPASPNLHQISAVTTSDHHSVPTPPSPAHQQIPTPQPHQLDTSGQRCKESATIPSTTVLPNPSLCNTLKV